MRRRPEDGLDIWEDDGGSWPKPQGGDAGAAEPDVEVKPIRIAAPLRPRSRRVVTRLVITGSPERGWIRLPDRRFTAVFVFYAALAIAAFAAVGPVARMGAGMAMAEAR